MRGALLDSIADIVFLTIIAFKLVTLVYSFGDVQICYKLNKKVFAQIYPHQEDYKITLKCTREAGEFFR